MGSGQSTGNGARPQAVAVKTGYYTLLGVERTASDSEIKKAYRKLALELHPDRNYGKEEWATAKFADIQTAYEVLSDPQERSWYDSHEASILRGADASDEGPDGVHYDHNVQITSADDVFGMMSQFRKDVEYTDGPTGFYGFVKALFDRLVHEERQVAAAIGVRWEAEYPDFGGRDSSYQYVVRPFYAAWSGFSTVKPFAWKDKYRLSDAADRPTRRAMEKENKKSRDAGIREFNDAVRTLVAFVKKRDPRWQANIQSERERQEAQRTAAAAQAARSRAENQAKLQEAVAALPEWVLNSRGGDGDGPGLDGESGDDDGEEDEVEQVREEFECVACNKVFKSEKQFESHEKSRQHQKAVSALRKKLRKEGQLFGLDEEDAGGAGREEFVVMDDDVAVDSGPFPLVDEDGNDTEKLENAVAEKLDGLGLDGDGVALSGRDGTEKDGLDTKGGSTGGEEESVTAELDGETGADADTDSESVPSAIPASANLDSDPDTSPSQPAEKKVGKAAQKRAKRAAKLAAAQEGGKAGSGAPAADSSSVCAVCQAAFPSRTRLFQHIQDFGHAVPVSKKEKDKTRPKEEGKGRRKGKR